MKIKKIEAMAVDLPLKRPIKMAGVEISTSENVFARIETDDGHVGWGEASAAPSMTGETVESMVAAVNFLAPFLEGRDPADFEENLKEMNWRMYGNASAKTIVEMALYDIAGKAQQKSIAEILGGVRRTEPKGRRCHCAGCGVRAEHAGTGCGGGDRRSRIDETVSSECRQEWEGAAGTGAAWQFH